MKKNRNIRIYYSVIFFTAFVFYSLPVMTVHEAPYLHQVMPVNNSFFYMEQRYSNTISSVRTINVYPLFAEEMNRKSSAKGDKTEKDINAGKDGSSKDTVLIKVAVIVVLIWAALALYLFTIDRRISRLEKRIDD